jgi:hypothetical protein
MPSVSARVTEPTLYKELAMMFRWVFFAILAVLVISWLFSKRLPWLEKLGLTKLSSNLTFRAFGKIRSIPVTYMVLLVTILYMTAYFAIALLYK